MSMSWEKCKGCKFLLDVGTRAAGETVFRCRITGEELKLTECVSEQDNRHGVTTWICERCGCDWQFTHPLPDDPDFNYCPSCGRKVGEES